MSWGGGGGVVVGHFGGRVTVFFKVVVRWSDGGKGDGVGGWSESDMWWCE